LLGAAVTLGRINEAKKRYTDIGAVKETKYEGKTKE